MKKFLLIFTLLFLVGIGARAQASFEPLNGKLEPVVGCRLNASPIDSLKAFVRGQYPHKKVAPGKWVLDEKYTHRASVVVSVATVLVCNKLNLAHQEKAARELTIDSIIAHTTFETVTVRATDGTSNSGWDTKIDLLHFFVMEQNATFIAGVYRANGVEVIWIKEDCFNLLMIKNNPPPPAPPAAQAPPPPAVVGGKKDTIVIVVKTDCTCKSTNQNNNNNGYQNGPNGQGIQSGEWIEDEDEYASYNYGPKYGRMRVRNRSWFHLNLNVALQWFNIGGQRRLGYFDQRRQNYPIFFEGNIDSRWFSGRNIGYYGGTGYNSWGVPTYGW